jgi:hypothetical protein
MHINGQEGAHMKDSHRLGRTCSAMVGQRSLATISNERAPWLFREHPMLDGPHVAAQMTTLP